MIDFLKQRKYILIIILSGIVILGFYITHNYLENTDFIEQEKIETKGDKTDKEEDFIVIHITGEVKSPGIVKVKQGSRYKVWICICIFI